MDTFYTGSHESAIICDVARHRAKMNGTTNCRGEGVSATESQLVDTRERNIDQGVSTRSTGGELIYQHTTALALTVGLRVGQIIVYI
jgi:hypothetical protein